MDTPGERGEKGGTLRHNLKAGRHYEQNSAGINRGLPRTEDGADINGFSRSQGSK